MTGPGRAPIAACPDSRPPSIHKFLMLLSRQASLHRTCHCKLSLSLMPTKGSTHSIINGEGLRPQKESRRLKIRSSTQLIRHPQLLVFGYGNNMLMYIHLN